MPSREQLRTYAEVAIMVGLGLEPNDRVLIEIPTALPDLAHDLVDVAYQGGAEDVEVLWLDTEVERSRFTSGGTGAAETVSSRSRLLAHAFDGGVSYLRVLAEDPAGMSGIDPGLIGRFTKVNNEVVFAARERQLAGEEPWTVISAPVPDWTGSVSRWSWYAGPIPVPSPCRRARAAPWMRRKHPALWNRSNRGMPNAWSCR